MTFLSDMFSRQTFDTLDDPTSSPPPGGDGEEEEIQPEMEEEDYRQPAEEPEPDAVMTGGKLLTYILRLNLTNHSHQVKIGAKIKTQKKRNNLVKWQQF